MAGVFGVQLYSNHCDIRIVPPLRGYERIPENSSCYSKSLRHHTAMQAILVAYYNFCRKHETIKTTPAVARGMAEKPWSIRELLEHAAS